MEGEVIDWKEIQKSYQPFSSISPHLDLDLSKQVVFSKATSNIYWTIEILTVDIQWY